MSARTFSIIDSGEGLEHGGEGGIAGDGECTGVVGADGDAGSILPAEESIATVGGGGDGDGGGAEGVDGGGCHVGGVGGEEDVVGGPVLYKIRDGEGECLVVGVGGATGDVECAVSAKAHKGVEIEERV